MILAVACLAAAFILAAAILVAVTVLIARTDRGDARAAINQVCSELDERLWDMPVPYRLAEDLEALVTATSEQELRWLPEDDDIIEGKRAL